MRYGYGRGCAAGASAVRLSCGFLGSGSVLEAPALVAGLDDVAVMGETVCQVRPMLTMLRSLEARQESSPQKYPQRSAKPTRQN
jgi:hypothetical protein